MSLSNKSAWKLALLSIPTSYMHVFESMQRDVPSNVPKGTCCIDLQDSLERARNWLKTRWGNSRLDKTYIYNSVECKLAYTYLFFFSQFESAIKTFKYLVPTYFLYNQCHLAVCLCNIIQSAIFWTTKVSFRNARLMALLELENAITV